MPYAQPAKSPNVEKLFAYLQKSQWHNVSANFSGFVRKEFESNLDKLEEDEETYRNLKLMIEYSEMGRFSEAKHLSDSAFKEFQGMMNKLTELNLLKHSPRRVNDRPPQNAGSYTERKETYTPDKRDGGNYTNRPQSYTPDKRDPMVTNRPQVFTPDKREIASPQKRNIETPKERQAPPLNLGQQSPGRHEVADRSPRTPQYSSDQPLYDPHRNNYDSLRLNSPEKQSNSMLQGPGKADSARGMSPADHPHNHDGRSPPASNNLLTSQSQNVSNKALWGRDHGDKPSEKVPGSTYRHDFPTYAMENHERKDKEMYRTNFGSLAERDIYRSGDDSYYKDDGKRGHMRPSETPDYDHRPSELARKFKDLYSNEWTDAYDEICKDFGSEKTVRHLLWIVTEAALIANDIADHQLRDLEKQAIDVMTTPGHDHEAWLIARDVSDKQLGDLEKAALGLMTTPGPDHDHQGGYAPRNLGDTIPASRSLLLKYRKQTALLSIPYVKEECRDKISRTLMESSGFPKSYLGDGSRLTAYIHKCAELTWLMCVQDPPIVLEYINKETEGARFNHEHYHVYTKSGTTYDFGVWPMLRLGKKGQILSKGIAQGI